MPQLSSMTVTRLACASQRAASAVENVCAKTEAGKRRRSRNSFIPVKGLKLKKETPQKRGKKSIVTDLFLNGLLVSFWNRNQNRLWLLYTQQNRQNISPIHSVLFDGEK
jgi:hypothetical protein